MSELAEILARRRLWEEETEARAASASHPPPPPPPAPSIPKPPLIQKQILPKPTLPGARPMSTPVSGVGASPFAPGIPASRPNSVPKTVAAAAAASGARPPLLRPVGGGGSKTNMLPPPIPLHHPPPPPAPSKVPFRASTPMGSAATTPAAVGEPTPKPAFVLRPASSRVLKQPSQSKLMVEHPPPPPPPAPVVPPPPALGAGGRAPAGLRPDSWIKTTKDDASNVSMRDLIRKSHNAEQEETPVLSRRSSSSSDVANTSPPAALTFRRMGGSSDLKEDPKKQLVRSSSSSEQRLVGGPGKPGGGGLTRSDSKSFKPLTVPQPTVKQSDSTSKPPNSPLQAQPASISLSQQTSSPAQKHVTSKEFAHSLGVMEDLRDKLVAFYELHNKLKLTSVDKILASFGMRGREQGEILLNQALMREYGVDLHTSSKANLITFTKALYKFTALQDGDLGFEAGQIIQVTDSSKDWWLGSYKLGDTTVSGVFPKNYVQDLSEEFVLETLAKQENTAKKTTVVAAAAAAKAEPGEYSPEDVKEDIFASHYFKSVLEVVTSELKYVVDLFTVNEVFVTKFQNHPTKSKYAADLFPSWISIVYAHENILGRLMEALPDSAQIAREFNKRTVQGVERKRNGAAMGDSLIKQVCGDSGAKLSAFQDKLERLEDTFVLYLESGKEMSPNQRKLRIQTVSEWVCRQSKELTNLIPFLKMSNQFILQYHSTLKKLEQFTGEDLQFINKLEAHPVMKTMKLRDFLIKPIQRVCKYPLLYREIIKYAPEEETRQIAKTTQDKFMSITEHVNLMIKQSELGNAKRLAELLTWVYPPTDLQRYELHVPHTLLTMRREGELVVTAFPVLDDVSLPTKQLTALLITDSLFLCDKQTITRLLAKPEQRLRIHHAIRFGSGAFDKITVTAKEEDGLELCLDVGGGGGKQTWAFKFPSQAGREGWLEDLNAAVERSEAVRNREREAHKQEQKIEKQRNARSSNPKPSPSAAAAVPEPPRRLGVLMGLMDELKYVQVLKGVSKDEV